MGMVLTALIVAGLAPLLIAVWANRRTSLLHALLWASLAWLCWGLAFFLDDGDHATIQPARYCALCLTGCAGIAVLGARRPHVFAWDFVVLGLFVVMALPLVETSILGTHSLDTLRTVFMAGAILVGVLNFIPTRVAVIAVLLAFIMVAEMAILRGGAAPGGVGPAFYDFALMLIPWLAWACLLPRRHIGRSDFDRLWLSFRDRWGFVWGQRVREQFNHAARNAGWPVTLAWSGLQPQGVIDEEYVETLRAVLQRFVEVDQNL